jgi:hypothetical protein
MSFRLLLNEFPEAAKQKLQHHLGRPRGFVM